MGARGRAHPSFGMTPTFREYDLWSQKTQILKGNDKNLKVCFFHLWKTYCSETYDGERNKLIQQAQQLSVDLEQARENLALKSRDSLKMQEQLLSVEGKLRETATALKRAEDELILERSTKDRLDNRYDITR